MEIYSEPVLTGTKDSYENHPSWNLMRTGARDAVFDPKYGMVYFDFIQQNAYNVTEDHWLLWSGYFEEKPDFAIDVVVNGRNGVAYMPESKHVADARYVEVIADDLNRIHSFSVPKLADPVGIPIFTDFKGKVYSYNRAQYPANGARDGVYYIIDQ